MEVVAVTLKGTPRSGVTARLLFRELWTGAPDLAASEVGFPGLRQDKKFSEFRGATPSLFCVHRKVKLYINVENTQLAGN